MSKDLLQQVSKEKLVEALMAERKEKEQLQALIAEVQTKGNKASEATLDNLQGSLASVMAEQVEYKEAIVEYDADGNAYEGSEERYTASPALLGVIEKFLKNNSIMTDISTNENTETLQKAMARKTRRSDNQSRLPTGTKVVDLMQQEG